MKNNRFYIFNSRITTHIIFWIIYYVAFSLIWTVDEKFKASFFLEFILLPIRMMAVYVVIYFLLPKFLIRESYLKFLTGYGIFILLTAILQRLFIHFFYEGIFLNDVSQDLFSVKMLLRAVVLINTTVFLVLSFKIFQLFLVEKSKNDEQTADVIEIKADRRIHRVNFYDILFIEGKGNYTTYHMNNRSRITAYGSIKKALESLPENFIRVHKSYIINKNEIKSFDANTIEIKDQLIPRGKSINDELLLIN